MRNLQEKQKISENKEKIKDEISFLAQMGIYTTEKEIYQLKEKIISPRDNKNNKYNFEWQNKISEYKAHVEKIKVDQQYVSGLNSWEKINVEKDKESYKETD